MARPMSEVLRAIYCRLELCSSVLQASDDCLRYGDITKSEHNCAEKMIAKWLEKQSDNIASNVTAKRISFKKFIQDTVENESLRTR